MQRVVDMVGDSVFKILALRVSVDCAETDTPIEDAYAEALLAKARECPSLHSALPAVAAAGEAGRGSA